MNVILWTIVGLLTLGVLFAVLYYKKNKGLPTNYKAMFIIGISWIPLGIATENYAFVAVGIVFMALGLKHKSKWKETSVEWSELTPVGKKLRVGLIAVAVLVLSAGVLVYFKTTGNY